MNPRRILTVTFWGVLLAVAVAIPTNDRRFSIEIWFSVFSTWTLGTMAYRLLSVSPVASTSRITVWKRVHRIVQKPAEVDNSLLGPRAAQQLMRRAMQSERAHIRDLRPRLQELAAFHLPLRHGVDPELQPDRTSALLGPIYWMIDSSVDNRRPTTDELRQFFDTVVGGDAKSGGGAKTGGGAETGGGAKSGGGAESQNPSRLADATADQSLN